MAPTALAQMIEGLPPEAKEAAEEYVNILHGTHYPNDLNEAKAKYREYIL